MIIHLNDPSCNSVLVCLLFETFSFSLACSLGGNGQLLVSNLNRLHGLILLIIID